jgi:hypothetical protein
MRVVLFSPFPPTVGGGSQNLRSAIPYLKGVEVIWAYLAAKKIDYPNSVYLGQPITNGSFFPSILTMAQICGGHHPKLEPVVEKLLEMDADCYWIVAHYEGWAIAEMLMREGRRVHLSFHDDPPNGLLGRSRRYWMLKGLCEKQTARLLKGASSVDVTSHRMGLRYQKLHGVGSVSYFPYIRALYPTTPPLSDGVLRVGFSGTLYAGREARIFGRALKIVSKNFRQVVEWHFWGLNDRQKSWVNALPVPAVFHPFVPEEELLPQLADMHALYAMYPFDRGSAVFSRTSHPAKLSTYLKAQRPIFAHTPLSSSLADFVGGTGIGIVGSSNNPRELARLFTIMLAVPIAPERYKAARDGWYGEENLKRLNDALLGINNSSSGRNDFSGNANATQSEAQRGLGRSPINIPPSPREGQGVGDSPTKSQ